MTVRKHSRQRDSIRDFLMTRKDHPSADTIYENLRKEFPNISLGTVYRNLSLLAETGEIQKLTGLDNSDRFDGNVEPHCHFYCTKCGSVTDLEAVTPSSIAADVQKSFAGRIQGCSVNFYGTCEKCEE